MDFSDDLRKWTAQYIPIKPVGVRVARGIVSFTFDDFPASAARIGADILEGAGLRGTFYACGGLMSRFDGVAYFDRADLRRLVEHGHEIGCHTFSHRRCFRIKRSDLAGEWRQNRECLLEAAGIAAMDSFAYPYGSCDLWSKIATARQFGTARGIRPGPNLTIADFAQLRSTSLGPTDERKSRALASIRGIAQNPGWLIFYTHDISRDPSPNGCHEEAFREIVRAVSEAGLEVLTVKDAADLVLKSPSDSARIG